MIFVVPIFCKLHWSLFSNILELTCFPRNLTINMFLHNFDHWDNSSWESGISGLGQMFCFGSHYPFHPPYTSYFLTCPPPCNRPTPVVLAIVSKDIYQWNWRMISTHILNLWHQLAYALCCSVGEYLLPRYFEFSEVPPWVL